MKILFDHVNITLFLEVVFSLILACFIFRNAKNKQIRNIKYKDSSRVFLLNISIIIIWIISMFLFRNAPIDRSLFWASFLYIVQSLIPSSFLYFSYIFPYQSGYGFKTKTFFIFLFNVIIVLVLLMPGVIIKGIYELSDGSKEIIFTELYLIYVLYFLVYFGLGFLRLFKRYLRANKIEKIQILYFFSGYLFIANLAFIANLIMPWIGFFFISLLGQIFIVFMIGLTIYILTAHKLLDIKFVLRESSVYIMSLIVIMSVFTAIKILLIANFVVIDFWYDLLVLCLAVSIFPSVKKYFYNFANRYFFSSLYDSKKIILEVNEYLSSTLDIKKVYNFTYEILKKALHFKSFGILRYNEKARCFSFEYINNLEVSHRGKFNCNNHVNHLFAAQNYPIVVEEIADKKHDHKDGDLIYLSKKNNIELLVPLNIKKKTVGILAFGPKESNEIYNEEDLKMFKAVSNSVAMAIENATLYQATKEFNTKLKKEVDKATIKLRKANEELKVLDKAKSEFIAIASHQLRTPLTAIKGYVSMILDGTFGKVPKDYVDPLQKVYQSGERLIRLVSGLLDISNIESGKFKFNGGVVPVDEIVKSVITELTPTAVKKGLELKMNIADNLPKAEIDHEKIRQVLINLIGNAVKYTQKGYIAISVKEGGMGLKFCVSDTGVGIDKEDFSRMFKKFSRGTGISVINAEGTGLGLYVAKQVIALHQGKIWVESEGVGKGSQFYFEIPLKQSKK